MILEDNVSPRLIGANPRCAYANLPSLCSSAQVRDLLSYLGSSESDFVLLQLVPGRIEVTEQELRRMVVVMEDTGSDMLYTDYRMEGEKCEVIDYQAGSLRDDFEFGPMVLLRAGRLLQWIPSSDLQYAGWYEMRLQVFASDGKLPFHLNEYLYTFTPAKEEKGSQFDYVNPRNRAVQLEYEQVVTQWLKDQHAWVNVESLKPAETMQPCEGRPVASVVIPVYNRVRTIQDAIRSALSQQTDFAFNVLVVDNHSSDGTTEAIEALAVKDSRVVHIIPEENTLLIGGCWNKAVSHPQCGNYIVQLDSDDMYSRPDTLQLVVNAFSEQNCMAVVGSYSLTDFDLNPLPPGIIDHREWTPENGMNNALRINGMGAPRAFRRDLLIDYPLPNTSYGEDYATMLRITREYRLGRIYEPLYDCRRWSGNSDAALSREKINRNNFYKDRIRTIEFMARRKQSAEQNR